MSAAVSPLTPVDTRTLELASRRVFDRASSLVGWGTGSVFDYFHRHHPVRLDALVDSDATRWGQLRGDIEITNPQELAHDATRAGANPFVIIYSSFWPEIQQALARIAPIPSLPASAVFADTATRAKLAWTELLQPNARPRRMTRTHDAVVIQGPIVPGVTPQVLRAMSALHPDNLLVLSTWDDTSEDLLAACAPFVDDVVLSAHPEPLGVQNRNCQIVSTHAGIARAIEHGARAVMKTRTDLAVLNPDVFAQARWWLGRMVSPAAHAIGLRDRLIVPSTFTRKYFLYHPSDLVMLGEASDMLTYWSAPLDPRSGTLLSPEWVDQPISRVNMSGNPTESYLGLAFCRAIGRPVTGTLRDSWAFYRDFFAVVDNDWFDLLWFKNLSIPDAALRSGVRQTMSHAAWLALQTDPQSVERTPDVDTDHVSLRALSGAAS